MRAHNLLVIDDDPLFLEEMNRRLRPMGFHVTSASNPQEAFDEIRKNEALEVILLNERMPGKGGLEMLGMIKKERPLLEVILLSDHGDVASAVQAIKLGAFDYLKRPCDFNELKEKVTAAAARRKDRERRIHEVRTRVYLTEQKRDELIAEILK